MRKQPAKEDIHYMGLAVFTHLLIATGWFVSHFKSDITRDFDALGDKISFQNETPIANTAQHIIPTPTPILPS